MEHDKDGPVDLAYASHQFTSDELMNAPSRGKEHRQIIFFEKKKKIECA